MKKTMFAVLCLAMTAITCMANNNNKGHNVPAAQVRHERVDHVINMEVASQMGLSTKKMHQIALLKEQRDHEMQALRAQHHADRQHVKGQHVKGQKPQMHKGNANSHRAKMHAMNEKYRKELRNIMGTKTYTRYVEKLNDRLAMHRTARAKHMNMAQHQPNKAPMAPHATVAPNRPIAGHR